jgi:DNA-binding response OmpR family regulator
LHPAQQSEASTISSSSQGFTSELFHRLFADSAPQAAVDGQPNLVLAIDDNPDAINLIRVALKGAPYTVVGVQDSLKVAELVQELQPCAIILDVMMPNLNGWQILHQLKGNPATAATPVVMLTVLSEPTTGYVLGADDYLIKPFKSDILLNTLHHLVAPPQGSSQASRRETQPV